MKKLLTLCVAIALASALRAQLPNNTLAPNFTAVDLDGKTWTMYDILESGKPVIMDISATWCGPCWNYHNSHALDQLWDEYGPDGTNELVVLFVEGDGSTNGNCLYGSTGCVGGTQGNWVEGTSTPIIDDANISELYEIAYYPTIYLICENHLVKEVGQLSKTALYNAAKACPDPVQGIDMKLLKFGSDFTGKICGDQVIIPSMQVLNQGTTTINTIKAEIKVNGILKQTKEFSIPIGTFIPRDLQFDPLTLSGSVSSSIVKMTVTAINGAAPAAATSKQITFQSVKKTTTQTLNLEINTDAKGFETYWELLDEQNNVVANGGNALVGPNGGGLKKTPAQLQSGAGAYANNTTINETIVVPASGCYHLHMVDNWGDGLCTSAAFGSYELTEKATPTNILTSGGCDFSNETNDFSAAGIVGVDDVFSKESIVIAPNPAADQVRASFNLKSNTAVQITVTNALGQVVRQINNVAYPAGANSVSINVSDIANGVYFLNMQTAEGSLSRAFSVKH